MSVTINGTNGLTFTDNSTQNTAATGFGFKNRIINGDMRIDQRNAGASVTPAGGSYTLDRWNTNVSQVSKFSVQQNAGSVTPPVGFTKYLGITSNSAYSLLVGDYFAIGQTIEGFNTADFAWGTANAKPVAISFWVYSSLVGTFSLALANGAYGVGYVTTYSVPVANTWTQVSVTLPGATTGTWNADTNAGIRLWFNLGAGSGQNATPNTWGTWGGWGVSGVQNVVSTNGATFYITGVQLEKGSTATSFDYRPYGTELALCQRYYQVMNNGVQGIANGTTAFVAPISFPVVMRTSPSVSVSSAVRISDVISNSWVQSSGAIVNRTVLDGSGGVYSLGNFTGLTSGRWCAVENPATFGNLLFSAEL